MPLVDPWSPSLPAHLEAVTDAPRLTSGDWRQDASYPEPLWAATAPDLARRVSIEAGRSLFALLLFSEWDDPDRCCAPLLAQAGWADAREYRARFAESARPVEDGFARRLCLTRGAGATAQPVDPLALVRAFVRAELARVGNVEAWLRGVYGERPPRLPAFEWIDYPVFDNGSMALGFALLVHGPELHVWSRARHAHK